MLNDCRDHTLAIVRESDTSWCERVFRIIHCSAIQETLDRHIGHNTIDHSLWRHVVLHNDVRIERVQVKRGHPVMRTDLRIFNIPARVRSLGFLCLGRDHDLLLVQQAINDRVPDRSRAESVCVVHTATIRHSEYQRD